ncbi:MAG: methionyl-tRNA formyltransferase, partial [Planctomycetota bacterium]
MRIVFLASGAFAQPTLRWLAQSQHEVALVVTQPAKGSGRGQHLTRTPVRAMADELGLETLEAENVNAPDVVARLCSLEASVGLVIAFGQKLGQELLGSMPGGCINLHASLLPKYRGAAPINWAVARGEEKTGCTV